MRAGGKDWRKVIETGGCQLADFIDWMMTRVWPGLVLRHCRFPLSRLHQSIMADRARYSDIQVRRCLHPNVIPEPDEQLDDQALHSRAAPFTPYIPTAVLPYIAFVLLTVTFALAFYSSTYVHVLFTMYSIKV